jgi:hypothetical protein
MPTPLDTEQYDLLKIEADKLEVVIAYFITDRHETPTFGNLVSIYGLD